VKDIYRARRFSAKGFTGCRPTRAFPSLYREGMDETLGGNSTSSSVMLRVIAKSTNGKSLAISATWDRRAVYKVQRVGRVLNGCAWYRQKRLLTTGC
jgi:hypothetical protein